VAGFALKMFHRDFVEAFPQEVGGARLDFSDGGFREDPIFLSAYSDQAGIGEVPR
jgi:hypothetical protein